MKENNIITKSINSFLQNNVKKLHEKKSIIIDAPYMFDDGDYYAIELTIHNNKFIISDKGSTIMHLSITMLNEFEKITNHKSIEKKITKQYDIKSDNGEFYVECDLFEMLTPSIIRLCEALTHLTNIYMGNEKINEWNDPKTIPKDVSDELLSEDFVRELRNEWE